MMVKTEAAIVSGEITTLSWVDLEDLVRVVIDDIGYTSSDFGYDGNTCGVINIIGKPVAIDAVLLSTQHNPEISQKNLQEAVQELVIKQVLPADLLHAGTLYHINPTGKFVIGSPVGDCGLSGRKIILDTYDGMARNGGGAFSGKDPSKVDRSAAYAGRCEAKNIVVAGLAVRCEIQVSYAVSVAEPTSISINTFGTGKISDDKIIEPVRVTFDLCPNANTNMLDSLHPMYRRTAAYGHFGRDSFEMTVGDDTFTAFPWEMTDKTSFLGMGK